MKKEIDYLINFKFTSSQFYCSPNKQKSEIIKNVINTENSEYIQAHCLDDLKGDQYLVVQKVQHND